MTEIKPARVFLLDGMALIYRAHFALIRSPIYTSAGINTSAIFGFANVLLDIEAQHEPTHLALVLDTSAPTARHVLYPEYKAQRDAMPEDIQMAIPAIERLANAFRIPVIKRDGYEADDIIGTLAQQAAADGADVWMVTPDKDYAQLVSERIRILKPGRQGSAAEILGLPEICENWGVARPEQVIDVLALWGDASDNIPGVPGIGEKTAKKLVAEFGGVEGLIANSHQLKGKQKENVEASVETARLARKLVTIITDVPLSIDWSDLAVQPRDLEALAAFMTEFEFNTLGKRLLGESFQAGRGYSPPAPTASKPADQGQMDLQLGFDLEDAMVPPKSSGGLKTLADVPHVYTVAQTEEELAALGAQLRTAGTFAFDTETDALDPKKAGLVGLSFSWKKGQGVYVPCPDDLERIWKHLQPVLEDEQVRKVGHNLKFDLTVLRWHGIRVRGVHFDTMLAHYLLEPDQRHGMDALAERFLGYSPIPITRLIGDKKNPTRTMREVPLEEIAPYATEDADVTWQFYEILRPPLEESGQTRVLEEIEMPLMPVLVEMEYAGIALNSEVLAVYSKTLAGEARELKERVFELAGADFNLNSPKQLGEILFEKLKLVEKPKKTASGQYATNEQVLSGLAAQHEIIRVILEYREVTKLKSTYVDALPACVNERDGRIHTTYSQTGAATGRLSSVDPNLQNIPIRTDRGQEIRKAFIASAPDRCLIAADYSQVELRVMASLSGDPGMLQAFQSGADIHAATAARVYGVKLDDVTSEMRRKAKMVNFGIIYGISAFGLAQRLGIGRQEAGDIIKEYFRQYPKVKAFMDATIEHCRSSGSVETMTGRRRVVRDIDSRNASLRSGAERMAINSPIQGTAADMIKIAMLRVFALLESEFPEARMLLQVHDEIVIEAPRSQAAAIQQRVAAAMRDAFPLAVPVEVDTGIGQTWLEAH